MSQSHTIDISSLPDAGRVDVGRNLYLMAADACPGVTAASLKQCDALRPSKDAIVNLGFQQPAHWFAVDLENTGAESQSLLFEIAYPLLDNITLWTLDAQGNVLEQFDTGDRLPFAQRPLEHLNFVFPINLPADEQLQVVFLVNTGSALQVPVRLWTPQAYTEFTNMTLMLFGLFIGAMLVMSIYNLMLFFSTGERSYLFFTQTLLFFAGVQAVLTGVSYAYVWPAMPVWNDVSLVVVACIALIGLAQFSRHFLRLEEHGNLSVKVLNLACGVGVLLILLTPLVSYHILIAATAFLVIFIPATAYVKSLTLWMRGYTAARYFALAFTLFVFNAAIFAISKYGWIERSLFTEYAIHFGAAATVTLLSLALADQVNQEKRAREAAQHSAIVSLKRFEELFNNSVEGIFTLDRQGAFTRLNPAMVSMLAAASAAQVKRHWVSISDIFAEPKPDVLAMLNEAPNGVHLDAQCHKIDGELFWAALNMRLVPDPDGEGQVIEGSMVNITERKENERKLQYLADYDQLTGLINRHAFQQRLGRMIEGAEEHKQEHALLYIDLDRFKLVNDTCGHHAGDELLKQLAVLFNHRVRQRDATARIGGDEFAILLEHCELEKAAEIGNDLRRELNKFRFEWQGKQFDIGASIGIVAINEYAESVANLMNLADSVCLMAKEQGRNRVIVHDQNVEEIEAKVQAKNLLSTIHEAIDKHYFVLFWQPIKSVTDDDWTAYEVLLRMRLGDEILSPGVFIPTAERYKVMPKIDLWVVTEFITRMQREPELLASLDMVTLNLSGQTLSSPDLMPKLKVMLREHPQIARKICFELTESAALNNLTQSSEWVRELKGLGVRFAIDDFGSGYASYSYLTQLPVDFVKIDGCFSLSIHNEPVNQAVIRSISEISHMMSMRVVAEFVETKDEYQCLRSLGVDCLQGYYLGIPQPLDAALDGYTSDVSEAG